MSATDTSRWGRPGPEKAEKMLTPGEVARRWGVDAKTITRWARAGKLPCHYTLGGHRRYRESEVRALLRGERPGGVPE